jgi:hypothetical protein
MGWNGCFFVAKGAAHGGHRLQTMMIAGMGSPQLEAPQETVRCDNSSNAAIVPEYNSSNHGKQSLKNGCGCSQSSRILWQ